MEAFWALSGILAFILIMGFLSMVFRATKYIDIMEGRRVKRVKKEEQVSGLLWWGYQHVNGAYHVKRYFDEKDIKEANESGFCYAVAGPFEAQNRNEALAITEGRIKKRFGIV